MKSIIETKIKLEIVKSGDSGGSTSAGEDALGSLPSSPNSRSQCPTAALTSKPSQSSRSELGGLSRLSQLGCATKSPFRDITLIIAIPPYVSLPRIMPCPTEARRMKHPPRFERVAIHVPTPELGRAERVQSCPEAGQDPRSRHKKALAGKKGIQLR